MNKHIIISSSKKSQTCQTTKIEEVEVLYVKYLSFHYSFYPKCQHERRSCCLLYEFVLFYVVFMGNVNSLSFFLIIKYPFITNSISFLLHSTMLLRLCYDNNYYLLLNWPLSSPIKVCFRCLVLQILNHIHWSNIDCFNESASEISSLICYY